LYYDDDVEVEKLETQTVLRRVDVDRIAGQGCGYF
jgi:hypothetical protein